MSTTLAAPGHAKARTPRFPRLTARFRSQPPAPAPENAHVDLGENFDKLYDAATTAMLDAAKGLEVAHTWAGASGVGLMTAPLAEVGTATGEMPSAPPWLHEDGTWTDDRIPAAAPGTAREVSPQVRAKLAEMDEQARAGQQHAPRFHAAPEADVIAAGCPPWYGHAATLPDNRAPHTRPFVPVPEPEPECVPEPEAIAEPPAVVPHILDDLRDLPCLRDAIASTMQRHCRECRTCGRTLPGSDWPERFAAQLAHIASGIDQPSRGWMYELDDEIAAGSGVAA